MSDFPLTWMADVLRAAGCTVIEEPDWKTRGQDGECDPDGIMLHHDASPKGETSSGADVIINGRDDLPGLLAQIWLDYDGAWHLCGAGLAYHAGEGSWKGVTAGNKKYIGVETDHTTNEEWTANQRTGGIRGLVALADHLGIRDNATTLEKWLIAHKEWAPTRKVDPDPLNMDDLRAVVLAGVPEEGFMEQVRKKNTVAQVIEADGDWHTIRLSRSDDPTGVYGVAAGPFHWLTDVAITTAEMPAGAVLLIRAVSTEGDADSVVSGAPVGSGTAADRAVQHFGYSAQGWTDEGQWLRVQVQATKQDVSLTLVETATTTW